ncbi:unnamed protein product [Schistocephalus solidus]|uniref:Reverse transcriptase domain-containing protein n=1 Tax=Schistocephalus solidus TaxID=70667 RepID=A0A183TL59_SCHSO|nr:unnamed protein product [Schistocephalus solidus]
MFADDIKIGNTIQSPDDEDKLQLNLTRLEEWSNHWLLRFNVYKCTLIRLGNPFGYAESRSYCLKREALKYVETQTDLGVLTATTLKPSSHCSKGAKSAIAVLHAIRRAFLDFDEDLFAKIFGTFIRPALEYPVQAWKLWTVQDQNCLERVQRKATKMVMSQSSLPYPTRLMNLHLFPLSYRQIRGDLVHTFSIVKGLVCCLEISDFFEFDATTHLRGHPLKLRVQ